MKKVFCLFTSMALAAVAFADSGPYAMSIGSGAGSLEIPVNGTSGIYSTGWMQGDTGTFNPGDTGAASTVWKSFFLLRNDTDNLNYFADNDGTHTPKIPDGTVATSPTSITNNNFVLDNDQTGSLSVNLTAPTAGDTAKLEYTWTVNNGTGTDKSFRLIYHFDTDNYLGTDDYADDLVARVDSRMGGTYGLALGENDGSGNLNLNHGILIDTDSPNTYFGMNNTNGPSNWWRHAQGYTTNGMDLTYSIDPTIENTVENDADTNNFSDSGEDSGGALQVNFVVPANGSKTVKFSATWGLNEVIVPPASVSDWSLYNE